MKEKMWNLLDSIILNIDLMDTLFGSWSIESNQIDQIVDLLSFGALDYKVDNLEILNYFMN